MEKQNLRYGVNVAVVGFQGHGKTTLVSAFTKYLSEKGKATFKSREALLEAPEEKKTGKTISPAIVDFFSEKRHYVFIDTPGEPKYIENLISSASIAEAAIFVVSATGFAMPQSHQLFHAIRQQIAGSVAVYINQTDLVSAEKLAEFEGQIREILNQFPCYDPDGLPIIKGSALKALEGDAKEVESIGQLLAQIDEYFPTPMRELDKPLVAPVYASFTIAGRGTVAAAKPLQGNVKVGDDVELVGKNKLKTVVTGVEASKKQLDSGEAGIYAGFLLRGLTKEEVKRGTTLIKPGAFEPHTKFIAEVYLLKADEGGRKTPIFTNFAPQLYVHTTDVTCKFILPEETKMMMPGDNLSMEIELAHPIFLESSNRFCLVDGNAIVGVGHVARILQ